MASTVRRYLDAIGGAPLSVRRRERAHCDQLLEFLQDGDQLLDRRSVEAWLGSGADGGAEVARHRLATLRRLVALTPGGAADELALWIDANRQRILRAYAPKVVPLRARQEPNDREVADRFATEARSCYERDEPRRARALARRALRLDACCLEAHAVIGSIELDEERPEAALRQFRQALVLSGDPGERRGTEGIAQVLDGLGRTLMAVHCLDEAYEVYRRLVHAGPRWNTRCGPILGRITAVLERPEEAAGWFATGAPVHQYGVLLARLREHDTFRAAIAFCRGLLANPYVPACLLSDAEPRFRDAFSAARVAELDAEAQVYADDWSDLWTRWRELLPWLHAMWDHPATRSFLMRALPASQRAPTSPRLGVFVHQAASAIKADLEAFT